MEIVLNVRTNPITDNRNVGLHCGPKQINEKVLSSVKLSTTKILESKELLEINERVHMSMMLTSEFSSIKYYLSGAGQEFPHYFSEIKSERGKRTFRELQEFNPILSNANTWKLIKEGKNEAKLVTENIMNKTFSKARIAGVGEEHIFRYKFDQNCDKKKKIILSSSITVTNVLTTSREYQETKGKLVNLQKCKVC